MSSTTTYPMPPGPAWATERRMEEYAVSYRHEVGRFRTVEVGDGGVEQPGEQAVEVSRWDTISDGLLTVGTTLVRLVEAEVTPADALVLAELLVQAADLAEQS